MKTIEVRCPACQRFLMEVNGYGRARCSKCGADVHFDCSSMDATLTHQPKVPAELTERRRTM